jgi:VWFA-related protein
MTFRRAVAVVLLLVAFGLFRPADPVAQAVQRSMYVSVVDENGSPVRDLGLSDFLVREDNAAREVLRVAPADAPMQVAVLVDNSAAARDHIRDLRQAITDFINAMTASDSGSRNKLAIIGLADRPTILTDFTSDRKKLLDGVGRVFSQPDSGTYLLDGVLETSQGFKKREAERPVILAIATEGAELSDRYHDQVLRAVEDAGAAFHALMIGVPSGSLRDEERERALVLAQGTGSSGGRYENLLTSMALPAKMKQVAAELTSQYLVTYARPQTLIPPEHVVVSATRPGLVARGTAVRNQREPGRP